MSLEDFSQLYCDTELVKVVVNCFNGTDVFRRLLVNYTVTLMSLEDF
jgi:hypothetical protein